MKKKALALLLATSMVAGLTACGGQTDAPATGDKTETNKTEDSGSASVDTSAIDTSEHVVITYMTTGDKPTGCAEELDKVLGELNKILTEKVNAELDIYFIELL